MSQESSAGSQTENIINLNQEENVEEKVVYTSQNELIKEKAIYAFCIFLVIIIALLLLKE